VLRANRVWSRAVKYRKLFPYLYHRLARADCNGEIWVANRSVIHNLWTDDRHAWYLFAFSVLKAMLMC